MGSEPRRMKAIIKDPQHCKRVAESVQLLNMKQDFMDLCFVCARGHRVFAHKLLLCSVSTQMKEMFLDNPDNTDLITIHLPDIEARLLRLMFDFLYEGALRLVENDYHELKNLMNLLGVVLKSRSDKAPQPKPEAQQPMQPQPTQLVYLQAPGPNSQGQVQYVLATPAMLSQGQVMQMAQTPTSTQVMQVTATPPAAHPQGQVMQVATPNTSLPQGQMMQMTPTIMNQGGGQMMMQVAQAPTSGQVMHVATTPTASLPQGQVMQVAAPNTSLPQGQMMQMAPTIMSQAGGQMVQGGSQVVTTPIQQNNMMQVVPQSGSQVPQSSQRPQYVMASTANQMTTSRARGQYTQPQTTPQQRTLARSRTSNQVAQPTRTNTINNVRTRRMMRAPVPMAQNRSLTSTRTIQRTRHSAQ